MILYPFLNQKKINKNFGKSWQIITSTPGGGASLHKFRRVCPTYANVSRKKKLTTVFPVWFVQRPLKANCQGRKKFFFSGGLDQCDQIGRIFAGWANFRRLGEFSQIGRIFADWANFRRLGEFSQIGRIFADWAISTFGQ
jgi:hypothetical protein